MTLPNFIVIGVAKAGTTSLYRYLDQHPQVYMYPEKGTNYFGYEDARSWPETDGAEPPLLRHFRVRTFDEYAVSFAGANDERAVGEVSPQYFRCPSAARRIRESLPDAKLVVSLRNPADRAFSGFLMRTRRGEVVGSAYDDLTPEASHVREGLYYQRLKRYFDAFPRDQIKVYLFDDLKRDPTGVVVDLMEYIGVDTAFVPDTAVRYNPASVPRSRTLNRLYFHPTLVRTAKAMLPERRAKPREAPPRAEPTRASDIPAGSAVRPARVLPRRHPGARAVDRPGSVRLAQRKLGGRRRELSQSSRQANSDRCNVLRTWS